MPLGKEDVIPVIVAIIGIIVNTIKYFIRRKEEVLLIERNKEKEKNNVYFVLATGSSDKAEFILLKEDEFTESDELSKELDEFINNYDDSTTEPPKSLLKKLGLIANKYDNVSLEENNDGNTIITFRKGKKTKKYNNILKFLSNLKK